MRGLSSIRLGIALLLAILIYASIMSALPPVRGALELTEMQAFDHWVFVTLVVVFCLALITATVTRIRWNLLNAGVLTVHSGLLLLVGGAAWYFGHKVEGDVQLLTPRIQLLGGLQGAARVLTELPARPGERWEREAPMLGGLIRLEVQSAASDASGTPVSARVAVQIGEQPPTSVDVSTDRIAVLDERLSLRLRTWPPETRFYDDDVAALYYRRLSEPELHQARLEGLPIYRERFLDDGRTIVDSLDRPVASKRTRPSVRLGPLEIPTHWFEPWRMPIRVHAPELPFDVEITGYLPYLNSMRPAVVGGGPGENPALNLVVSAGRDSIRRPLLAFDPARSLLDLAIPFEFCWVRSEEQLEELLKDLPGPHELTVELRDPPARQVLAVQAGQTLEVGPYTLTVQGFDPSWELVTPGFEGARSPAASVAVRRGELKFTRMVLQRFPERSQDVDEQGVRKRDGLIDPNITLRYRTCAGGRVLIVAGPDIPPVIAVFEPGGRVSRTPATVGRRHSVRIAGLPLEVQIADLYRNGQERLEPVVEPLEVRRPNIGLRSLSAIRLRLSGRGADAGWSDTQWVMFSPYPHIEPQPIHVHLPSGGEYELIYSRLGRELGVGLAAGRLSVRFFPGRQSVESWRSDFVVVPRDRAPWAAFVETNQTATVGPWTLFQSGAANDHWSFTVLGVGNRRGIWPMILGCIMIPLGSVYAFYVKPLLIRARQRRALAEARARQAAVGAARTAEPEAAGVR